MGLAGFRVLRSMNLVGKQICQDLRDPQSDNLTATMGPAGLKT